MATRARRDAERRRAALRTAAVRAVSREEQNMKRASSVGGGLVGAMSGGLSRFALAWGLVAAGLASGGCAAEADAAEAESRGLGDVAQELVGVTGATWMSAVNSELLLSQVSIPGTHDTMALYEPFAGTAKCQNLSLADQLNAGVRFLDVRCRHFNNAFTIHHGSVYQNANFDDVLNAVIAFLNAHPSEAVIMSVKEEHTASGNTRSFEQTFDAYVASNPGKWNLGTGIPTLGAARGKITLLRRFGGGAKGINASSWPDNTTFTSGDLRVQDNYNVGSTDAKWNQVNGLLGEAYAGGQGTLYLNFSSGVYSFIGIPNVTTVSNAINPKLGGFFANASGRYGILAMDFVDAARTAQVYNSNSGYLAFRSYNFSDGFITARGGAYEVWRDANASDDSAYQVVPGLADAGCVSFRSKRYPDRYLRHSNYALWADVNTGGVFAADATFCVRPALGGDSNFRSFESKNFPNHFIRHASGRVRIDPFEDTAVFRQDATWQYTPR
jgi:alpha-L-arabinofuranosidase B-like protein/phosphatidylinositol-specific phospholipase C-like protein